MIDINELRKLAQAALVAPDGLSAEWMNRLGQFQESVSPAAITELLDRLEAAEEERDRYKLAYNDWIAKTEWLQEEISSGALPAKYLGMHRADGIKVEIDRLRAKVEAAERERDDVAQQLVQAEVGKRKLDAECDALRAKITEMEQQEPAGTLHDDGYFVWRRGCRPYEGNYVGWMMKLYALPGAKGE